MTLVKMSLKEEYDSWRQDEEKLFEQHQMDVRTKTKAGMI